MNGIVTAKELKGEALRLLRLMVPGQKEQLAAIDVRLVEYYEDLCEHSGTELGDENDWHGLYELLGALKVLRLFRQYEVDARWVRMAIRLREGEWHREGDKWVYDKGGLLMPGTHGATHYRWMAFQVFILAAMYGCRAWVDTEMRAGSREMLKTERVGKNGNIEDNRRLCVDFTDFTPRKTDKTGMAAYNIFLFFMLGDWDAQIMCCANAFDQSRILYKRATQLIAQTDPDGSRIRFTEKMTNWKPGQVRQAELSPLSAGGKTKDGLCAQLCCADEYGSAGYVSGTKSDMGALVNVVLSSMGPRREPMMFTSTTAGNIMSGPFMDKLAGIKTSLTGEVAKAQAWERGEEEANEDHVLLDSQDRWTTLLLMPDDWESKDEEYVLTSKTLRKKINPALGYIVQHSFYDQETAAARLDPLRRVETLTKLYNIWQTDVVKDWSITADKVRRLQVPRRITDCRFADGWDVYVGMDFGGTDDLCGISYFGVNRRNPALNMQERFFADCEAWIVESDLNRSPNRALYERWISDGWLHVCKGDVFDASLAINELMTKNELGVNLAKFGYDPAQAKQPINTLKAWLQSLGMTADVVKEMVVPVAQSFMNFNPIVGELEVYVLSPEPWLRFSASPLWPWEFGNAQLVESKDGLRKVLKSSEQKKVDNIHALVDAMYCFDLDEGT